ncbi:MAG TPA: hypothetical protein G4O18_04295 [Dehalococcoidia bacterium]|nr:hypothetical protein [Dehalococcoidia bacterium]
MSGDNVIKEGHIYGGWRKAVNAARGAGRGSIHDDATAQQLGMRGGAVVGIVHLNLFPPLILETLGQHWFEKGSLSIFYTYALVDGEEVRGIMGIPPEGKKDVQVEAWAESRDDHTVGTGTIAMGEPEEPSYIQTVELKHAAPGELRILAGLNAGDELPSREVIITREMVDRSLETITDTLDWYKGDSPWGGAIAPPSLMHRAMNINPPRTQEAVGFFGATELRNVNGPVKVDVPYRAGGKLACVGTSSKTEFYWIDTYLEEVESGKRVAEMRHMTRLMKASSPLYK